MLSFIRAQSTETTPRGRTGPSVTSLAGLGSSPGTAPAPGPCRRTAGATATTWAPTRTPSSVTAPRVQVSSECGEWLEPPSVNAFWFAVAFVRVDTMPPPQCHMLIEVVSVSAGLCVYSEHWWSRRELYFV